MFTNKETFGTGTKFSAVGTGLGSMVGIDFDNSFSINNPFIFNKSLELKEAPIMQPESLLLSDFSISNPLDIFHYNNSLFTINNLFADVVVNPSHQTVFSSRDFLQKSFTRKSAFRLEFSPQTLEHKFFSFNLFAVKKLFVGSNCDIVDSNINSKKSVKKFWSDDVFGQNNMQKQSFIINQISTTRLQIKILPVIFWNFYRNFYSSINSAKTNIISFFIVFKTKRTGIISDCKMLFKNRLSSWLGFKNFSSFISATANKLCRKFSFLSDFIVSQVMKLSFIVCLNIPSKINNFVSRIRILLHSFYKGFIIWNLNFYDGFHRNISIMFLIFINLSEVKSNSSHK